MLIQEMYRNFSELCVSCTCYNGRTVSRGRGYSWDTGVYPCTSKSMYYIKPKVNNFSCHFDFLKIAHRQFGNSYLTSATFNHSKVTLREEAGQN